MNSYQWKLQLSKIFKAADTNAGQVLFTSVMWADCNDNPSFFQATKIVKQLFKTLSEDKKYQLLL